MLNPSKPVSWLSKDTRVPVILISFVAILISLVLSLATRSIGWGAVFFSVVFSLSIVVLDLVIVAHYVSALFVERLSESERSLMARFDGTDSLLKLLRSAAKAEFVRTQEEVMEYERTNVREQVWILSASLNDEFVPGISQIISENLERGVKYVYIIPNDVVVIERVRKIRAVHGNSPGVKWFHMTREFFDLVPPHDISIYDPLGTASDQIVGFMNVPAKNAPGNLFVLLEGSYATGLIRTVLPTAKNAGLFN